MSKQFVAMLGFALLGLSIHAADKPPAKGIPIAKVKHSGPVDFEKEILPILKNNCLACHNQTKAKAGLVLETPQAILKGGDTGPSVVPKKPRESLLLKAAAHQDEELIMPPRDNKVAAVALKPEELGLVQLWIEQGAKGQVRAAAPIAWQSMPSALNTIYALALTRDGQFAACGRANQLFVYHLPSTQLVARLADGKLGTAAHRDTVNALAFSPDGEILASGGYRDVKLWRRAKPQELKLVQRVTVDAIAVSSDGNTIGVVTNGRATLWSAAGKFLRALAEPPLHVTQIAFSTDAKMIGGIAGDAFVTWNSSDGGILTMLTLANKPSVLAWLSQTNVAVGCADGGIRIFGVMSATVLPRDDLKEHTGAVTALAAAGDGKTLLSGGEDGALRVWDGLTPRLVQEVKHGALVADVSFGAEGKLFASTGTNGAKLWWLSQSNYLAELKGERVLDDKLAEAERELAFAKGEAEFRKAGLKAAETNQTTVVARQKKAAATNDAIAKLFGEKQIALTNAIAAQRDADKALDELGADVRKLVEAWFVAERESTNAAALAKTAKDTSAKNADKLAAEVEAKTNLLAEAKAALENLPAETKAKQKSTTDKLIAANKAVIDAEKELKKLEPAKSATENEVHLAANALKRAEEVIAAAKSELSKAETGATNAVTIVDDAKKVLNAADQPIRSITFSENGGLILSLREDGALQKWTGENGVPCETSLHLPGARVVKALNAGRVLVASADAVSIWDIAPKWTLERMIGTGDVNSPLADRVNAIRFTPDGRQLITAGGEPSRGGEIKIWRVKDGTLVRELNNIHSDSVFALDVSADGKLLASGAADRFAKVTELNTGKVLKVFEGHTHHVLGVAWKRDQRTLLTAGADNVAKVWDASTGERRKNIEGFGKEVTAATFIGVGDEVVLTAGDGQVALVKDKGDKVRSFSGANDYVYATAVTPDGSVVVAGGADGVLRAWNGKDGKLLAEFAPRDLPPLR